jgi:hypothetical protein
MFVHAAQDTLEYIRTEGCMDPTEVACFVSISIFSKRLRSRTFDRFGG